MANKFAPPPTPKNAMDNGKIGLTAKPVDGSKIPAKMKIGFYNNNPNISVFTGAGKGAQYILRFGCDMPSFLMAMDILEQYGNEKDPQKQRQKENYSIDSKDRDRTVKATLYIGRNDDGVMYLSVIEPGKDFRIPFYITPGYYHGVQKNNGEDVSKDEASRSATRAFVNMMKIMVPVTAVDVYQYYNPNDNSGGGNRSNNSNQGSSNNNSGGGGGSTSDDDLPF